MPCLLLPEGELLSATRASLPRNQVLYLPLPSEAALFPPRIGPLLPWVI